MDNGNLDKHLNLFVDGRITFDAFVSATRREFERMATYLLRRWLPPAWYVSEDVIQELYIGAWIWVWNWERNRGPGIGRYVVFNAISHAKRALHKARGAKLSGSADKNPSHFERPLSSFGPDEDFDLLESIALSVEPEAEAKLVEDQDRKDSIDTTLESCESAIERTSILAIAEAGDVDGGGRLLYDDIDARIQLRLWSEEHAVRLVARTASRVIARMHSDEETFAS